MALMTFIAMLQAVLQEATDFDLMSFAASKIFARRFHTFEIFDIARAFWPRYCDCRDIFGFRFGIRLYTRLTFAHMASI